MARVNANDNRRIGSPGTDTGKHTKHSSSAEIQHPCMIALCRKPPACA